MKLIRNKEEGTRLEFGDRAWCYFNNDWRQLFQIGRCNWYSLHFAYLYFEVDEMSKTFELVCIVLGLGFTLRIDRDFANSEIKQRADEAYERIMLGETEEGGFAVEESDT